MKDFIVNELSIALMSLGIKILKYSNLSQTLFTLQCALTVFTMANQLFTLVMIDVLLLIKCKYCGNELHEM